MSLDPDYIAVRDDKWWLADVMGNTMPVRHAVSTDRKVWTIEGQKVAVIELPEPATVRRGQEKEARSRWAIDIGKKGRMWLKFAIAVYQDKWTFTQGDEETRQRLGCLEEVLRFAGGGFKPKK